MAYEVIEKGRFGSHISDDPTVTVTKDSFYINKAARRAFAIEEHKFLEMSIDRAAKTFAFKLLDEETPNSRKIGVTDGSLNITAQSVITRFGIAPGRYALSYDKHRGLLEFSYDTQSGSDDSEAEGKGKEHEHHVQRRGRPRKAA